MEDIYTNSLADIRRRSKKTQEDVSAAVSIKKSTYSSYEREQRILSLRTLRKLAEYFDVYTTTIIEPDFNNILIHFLLDTAKKYVIPEKRLEYISSLFESNLFDKYTKTKLSETIYPDSYSVLFLLLHEIEKKLEPEQKKEKRTERRKEKEYQQFVNETRRKNPVAPIYSEKEFNLYDDLSFFSNNIDENFIDKDAISEQLSLIQLVTEKTFKKYTTKESEITVNKDGSFHLSPDIVIRAKMENDPVFSDVECTQEIFQYAEKIIETNIPSLEDDELFEKTIAELKEIGFKNVREAAEGIYLYRPNDEEELFWGDNYEKYNAMDFWELYRETEATNYIFFNEKGDLSVEKNDLKKAILDNKINLSALYFFIFRLLEQQLRDFLEL